MHPDAPRHAGFTLVELGSSLVVLAVLAAIAVPVWRSHQLREGRREATAALRTLQAAEEAFLVEHGHYARDLGEQPPGGLGLEGWSPTRRYRLTLAVGPGDASFVATARAEPGPRSPADPRCRAFTLDQNGLRQATDAAGTDRTEDCWR